MDAGFGCPGFVDDRAGLALFYGGLVRKKNILATMMQSFAMMCLVTVLWAVVGYSLAFGHGSASSAASSTSSCAAFRSPQHDYARHHSRADLHGLPVDVRHHHPALITGAFAERMKFSAMAVFLSLWSLIVYCRWPTWSGAWEGC